MTYKTHFVGGICATALTSMVVPMDNMVVVGAVSAFSALIPDIDIEGSKVNNKAGIVGKGVSSVFSHRGFIHTPILYIAFYFLMSMVLPQAICLGFLIGTLSHLVLDTFNYKGIMWLYPLTKKHYHIASIKTRTFGETAFMVAMIVATAFLFISDFSFVTVEGMELVESVDFQGMKETAITYLENIDFVEIYDKCSSFVSTCVDMFKEYV